MGRSWPYVSHEVCNVCLRQGMLPMGYVAEPFGKLPKVLEYQHGLRLKIMFETFTLESFLESITKSEKRIERCDDSEERRRLSVRLGSRRKRNMPTMMKSLVFVY